MPQIIYEEITKKNVLDNSLRPFDNEICNIIRRECNDAEVLKTTKGIYVEGKVNGRNVRFLVDSGADMILISLTTLQQFPERLRSEWREHSLEIYAINGDEIQTWGSVQVNLEIKRVVTCTQVYASDMLEPGVLGLPALFRAGKPNTSGSNKSLRAIIDLEKKELLVKKPVEELELHLYQKHDVFY